MIYGVPDAVSWEFFLKNPCPDVPQTLFQRPPFLPVEMPKKTSEPKQRPFINYNRSKAVCATPFK
jgi:hypothetical protein